MANTREIVRLMRHVATLLDEQNPGANANHIQGTMADGALKAAAWNRAAGEAAAIGAASVLMRMVAATLEESDTPDNIESALGERRLRDLAVSYQTHPSTHGHPIYIDDLARDLVETRAALAQASKAGQES